MQLYTTSRIEKTKLANGDDFSSPSRVEDRAHELGVSVDFKDMKDRPGQFPQIQII